MSTPSPYGPDRSLFVATVVLLGGGLFVVGTIYLLSSISGDVASWHQARLAERETERRAVRSQARTSRVPQARSPVRGFRSSGAVSPPMAVGRAPAWAGSDPAPLPPPRAPRSGGYDLRADLGHADLGSPLPSPSAAGASPTGGSVSANAGPATAGRAPRSVDLGGTAAPSSAPWRSELSQLNGRLRALDGALAQLDRTPRSVSGSAPQSQSGENGSRASGGSAAATTNNTAPGMPADPSQVPVDGGLGWLAAAGAAYAARRLHQRSEDGSAS